MNRTEILEIVNKDRPTAEFVGIWNGHCRYKTYIKNKSNQMPLTYKIFFNIPLNEIEIGLGPTVASEKIIHWLRVPEIKDKTHKL